MIIITMSLAVLNIVGYNDYDNRSTKSEYSHQSFGLYRYTDWQNLFMIFLLNFVNNRHIFEHS